MSITDATERMQLKVTKTDEKVREIESAILSKFECDLKLLCSSAESTLQNALEVSKSVLLTDIDTYKTDLSTQLTKDSKEMTDQLAILKKEVAKWTPKLVRLVKLGIFLPIAATIVACGLMILTTWAWMPKELWKIRASHQKWTDGRTYLVIDDPTWVMCNISRVPKAQVMRPCKTGEWESPLPAKK